jgi:hypothetical protein
MIEAWCQLCKKLKRVDTTGYCERCRKRLANRRRWKSAVNWRENERPVGGPIYAAVFSLPDLDDEEAPLCTRCRHVGSCGVIEVDDEHLLSGCDLWERRRTKEEMRAETAELVKDFPHEAYAEDIGKAIKRVGEQLKRERVDAGDDEL